MFDSMWTLRTHHEHCTNIMWPFCEHIMHVCKCSPLWEHYTNIMNIATNNVQTLYVHLIHVCKCSLTMRTLYKHHEHCMNVRNFTEQWTNILWTLDWCSWMFTSGWVETFLVWSDPIGPTRMGVGVGVAQTRDVIEQNRFQIRNQRPKITHNQLSNLSHLKKKFCCPV